ncbi:hypothetical protein GLYMA_16G143900v4 [Glycine max]|nr:hypothetical protein GLYMA_16G143900v4 [Glycine max]KAH1151420.1 hypothetical protein GYH30_045096 [Glycine max]KAH1206535.1 hypothetical protein GmHk_16G046958 [Glycine max]
MCFKVLCRRCGKYTWGGCGNHLSNVYNSIEEGNHCMCRSWPGLVIPRPTQEPTKSSTTPPQDNGNPRILEAIAVDGLQ